jgi:hypothetical protein
MIPETEWKEKRMIYLYRHTRHGRSSIVPCTMRLMSAEDFDDARALHRSVTKGLSRDIFAPTPDEDLVRLLAGEGISLGVWHEAQLICMRAIVTGGEWMEEILTDMGVPRDPTHRTAYTEHCIVERGYRGNNIQFLTHYRIENYIADHFDTVYTTVAPKNIFSLQNVLACDFVVVGMRELYGGYMRYVLSKSFQSPLSIWTNGHYVVPITDVERQKRLLADGYVGYKAIRKQRGFWILYAPSSETDPAPEK